MAKAGTRDSGGVRIVESDVNTRGGDIVGRDKIQHISTQEINSAFSDLETAIDHATTPHKAAATETLRALKEEIEKGQRSNDSTIAKLVEGIAKLVPSAVGAIAKSFADPLLSNVLGPVTKYVLEKMTGK